MEATQATPPEDPNIAPAYDESELEDSTQRNEYVGEAFGEKQKQVNFSIKVQPNSSGHADEKNIFQHPTTAYTLPTFNSAEKTITPEIYDIVQTRLISKSDNRNHDVVALTFADETSLSQPETRWM